MPAIDRKLILLISLALIVVSAGILFLAQKPAESASLLKAPPETITPTPQEPRVTLRPAATPKVAPATTDGEYFILLEQNVLEIDADKKTVRNFPFPSRSAQRLASGMTLFSFNDRVFETDAEGQIIWEYNDVRMNATSAWRRDDGITVVSDANGRILKIAPDAQLNAEISLGPGSLPASVFPLTGDDALVADTSKNTVTWIELDKEGSVIWKYGQESQQAGFAFDTLNAPSFAFDISGQSVLIADAGNNRVLEVPYSSKQSTWEINHVPKPQSAFLIGRMRLTASERGAELIYQNRTFDWKFDDLPVYRVFPVKNLPAPMSLRTLRQAPFGITGFITGFQKSILRFFEGN